MNNYQKNCLASGLLQVLRSILYQHSAADTQGASPASNSAETHCGGLLPGDVGETGDFVIL